MSEQIHEAIVAAGYRDQENRRDEAAFKLLKAARAYGRAKADRENTEAWGREFMKAWSADVKARK